MNDTKTRASEYLEAHQEVKEIFATKDGFLFEKNMMLSLMQEP